MAPHCKWKWGFQHIQDADLANTSSHWTWPDHRDVGEQVNEEFYQRVLFSQPNCYRARQEPTSKSPIAFPRETLKHGNKTRNTLHLRKQSVICGPQKKVEYKQWPHTLNSGSQNRLWFQPNCDPFKYRLINSIPREQRPPEEELRCMTMIPWTLMQWLSSVNWITDIGFGYQVDCMKTLHSNRLSTVTVPHPSNKIHYETKLTTGSEKV